jgi:hypothetical protein
MRVVCLVLAALAASIQVCEGRLRRDLSAYSTQQEDNRDLGFKVSEYIQPRQGGGSTNDELLDEDGLTECPPTDRDSGCPKERSTMICGKLRCLYKNNCTAESAGWNVEEQCKPRPPYVCPVIKPGRACPEYYQETTCGKAKCKYGNPCFAANAGWNMTKCEVADLVPDRTETTAVQPDCTCPKNKPNCECSDICPPNDPLVRCASSPNAYLCGVNECFYGSKCVATTSSWSLDQCTPIDVETFEKINYEYDEDGCPLTLDSVKCTAISKPVKCKDATEGAPACKYSNICFAKGAGWDTVTECDPVSVIVTSTTAPASKCPGPDKNTFCTFEYMPVMCSNADYSKCKYSNKCIALSSGFNAEKECDPVSE